MSVLDDHKGSNPAGTSFVCLRYRVFRPHLLQRNSALLHKPLEDWLPILVETKIFLQVPRSSVEAHPLQCADQRPGRTKTSPGFKPSWSSGRDTPLPSDSSQSGLAILSAISIHMYHGLVLTGKNLPVLLVATRGYPVPYLDLPNSVTDHGRIFTVLPRTATEIESSTSSTGTPLLATRRTGRLSAVNASS